MLKMSFINSVVKQNSENQDNYSIFDRNKDVEKSIDKN